MGATTISWCDHSINPIRARQLSTGRMGHYCEKISPGCKNCYSSRLQTRFGMPEFHTKYHGDVEPFLDRMRFEEVLRRRKPTKYFWCDMTDIFGDWVPDIWLLEIFDVMRQSPHHTHMVLTKRPERMADFCQRLRWDDTYQESQPRHLPLEYRTTCGGGVLWLADDADGPGYRLMGGNGCEGMPWVWMGVSVESREHLARLDYLRDTPAAVRFVSFEPLLEDLGDIRRYLPIPGCVHFPGQESCSVCRTQKRGDISWIIVGGE